MRFETDQQKVFEANGVKFSISELICLLYIIINGFHFPYPLNGTNKPGGIY